jgi:hypothetical protein
MRCYESVTEIYLLPYGMGGAMNSLVHTLWVWVPISFLVIMNCLMSSRRGLSHHTNLSLPDQDVVNLKQGYQTKINLILLDQRQLNGRPDPYLLTAYRERLRWYTLGELGIMLPWQSKYLAGDSWLYQLLLHRDFKLSFTPWFFQAFTFLYGRAGRNGQYHRWIKELRLVKFQAYFVRRCILNNRIEYTTRFDKGIEPVLNTYAMRLSIDWWGRLMQLTWLNGLPAQL